MIAGVGSVLRGDDAIGIEALAYLKENLSARKFDFLEFSAQSIGLINYIKDYRVSFIIDAVDFKKEPGFVRAFQLKDISPGVEKASVSSHGLSLKDFLKLHKALKIKNKVYVVGIQPKDITFKRSMSAEVSASLPKVLSEIEELVKVQDLQVH